jgi:endonuclease/exonuclease/phosphatase family metal-dependent hydrolase
MTRLRNWAARRGGAGVFLVLGLLACSDRQSLVPPNGTGDAGVDGAAAGEVTVAAFNVARFFDTNCDTGSCGSNSFEQALTATQFKAKADQIAQGIESLNADVVLLEELEKEVCATALQERLPAYKHRAFGETNFAASLDVGVIAKDEIKAVRTHRQDRITLPNGRSDRFTREFLEVDLVHEGVPYTVFVAHFKSKAAPDDPDLRLGEAQAARAIVLKRASLEPSRLLVLGGDFNDTPGSAPINTLESSDASGQLARVAARDLPPAEQTSYFGPFASAIDHLFVPAPLVEQHIKGSTRIAHEGGRGLAGSDHGAIVARFKL